MTFKNRAFFIFCSSHTYRQVHTTNPTGFCKVMHLNVTLKNESVEPHLSTSPLWMLVFIFSVRCSTLAWKHRVSYIKPATATLTLQSLIAEWRAAGNIYTTKGRHILSFTQLVSPRGLMHQKCRFTTPNTCTFYCYSLWSLKKCFFFTFSCIFMVEILCDTY